MKKNRMRESNSKHGHKKFVLNGQFIWVVLLTSNVAFSRMVSRVQNILIEEESNRDINPQELNQPENFSGSLIQDTSQPDDGSSDENLSFDFRLLHNTDKIFRKSYRAEAVVSIDLAKVKEGVYKDSFNQDNFHRFSVNFFNNNELYRGVEPRVPFTDFQIKELSFTAKINQTENKINSVELLSLNLQLFQQEKIKNKITETFSFKLNFSSRKNTEQNYTGFWCSYFTNTPWLLPILFLHLVVYVVTCFFSAMQRKVIGNSDINKDMRQVKNHLPYMYQHFNTFSKLQLLPLASIIFLYVSPWSVLFLSPLVILEFISQTVGWLFYYLAAQKFLSTFFDAEEIYFPPLFTIFCDLAAVLGNEKVLLRAKNIFGIFLSMILLFYSMFYPKTLVYANWFLAVGAVYCSVFTKYQNPCLMDFVSWVCFFDLYMIFNCLHISCYLAIGYHASFLTGFFSTWLELLYLQFLSLFSSIGVMIVLIFLDFALIKSNALKFFFPKKVVIDQRVVKQRVKHRPGVVYFEQFKTLYLRNFILGGRYFLDEKEESTVRLGCTRAPEAASKASTSWLFTSQNHEKEEKKFIIERVYYQNEEKTKQI